jgi:hypothetical protein
MDDILHAVNELFDAGIIARSVHVAQVFQWSADPKSPPTHFFNITAALELVKGREANAEFRLDHWVSQQIHSGHTTIDKVYAKSMPSARIGIPTISATIEYPDGDLAPILIDGNHRAYAAWMRGWKKYPSILLSLEESKKILVDPCVFAREL